MSNQFILALCQTKSFSKKEQSMEMARTYVNDASGNGADIISLPEMWNCPYDNRFFKEYSEPETGRSVEFMSNLAKKNKIYLIGGTIPERDGENIYNTCFIFDKNGDILGKHRKIHLFDIDVKGGISFKESETLSGGNQVTIIETELCKIGIGICYDVRFPGLFAKMAHMGAKLIVLPAAFNMTTGPAHWDLLMRARALDNQLYFAANSPARDMNSVYHAYGHSMIVDPWGEICGKTNSCLSIVYGKIDPDYVDSVREQIPTRKQGKPNIY